MLHKVVPIFLVLCVNGLNSSSDGAVSVQSFHPIDAPVSYKFTQVHSPQKKIRFPQHQSASVEKKLKPVQYAPIPFKAEYLQIQPVHGLYMSTSKYGEVYEVEKDIGKVNVEPFIEGSRFENFRKYHALHRYDNYAPGHNIELLRHHPSVKHPIHAPPHAVLITNQIPEQIAITTEISTHLPNISETMNTTASISPMQFSQINDFYTNLLQRPRPDSSHQADVFHDDHIPAIVERHQRHPHAAYALIPRRYMNVARTYGIAYNSNKAPTKTFSNKYLTLEQSEKQKTAELNKRRHF